MAWSQWMCPEPDNSVHTHKFGSWVSSISVMTKLRTGWQFRNCSWVPENESGFSLLQSVQTGIGARTDSYSFKPRAPSPGVKQPWRKPDHFYPVTRLRISKTIPPLPLRLQGDHRDNCKDYPLFSQPWIWYFLLHNLTLFFFYSFLSGAKVFHLFNGRVHFYVVHLDGGNGGLTFGNVSSAIRSMCPLSPQSTKFTVILMGIRNTLRHLRRVRKAATSPGACHKSTTA